MNRNIASEAQPRSERRRQRISRSLPKALTKLKAKALFFSLSQDRFAEKPHPVGPIMKQLRYLNPI